MLREARFVSGDAGIPCSHKPPNPLCQKSVTRRRGPSRLELEVKLPEGESLAKARNLPDSDTTYINELDSSASESHAK